MARKTTNKLLPVLKGVKGRADRENGYFELTLTFQNGKPQTFWVSKKEAEELREWCYEASSFFLDADGYKEP
jgi:hypothetical protein